MIRNEKNGLVYYQFSSFSATIVEHGIFTRLGGVSQAPFDSLNLSLSVPDQPEAVNENRHRFYSSLEVNPEQAVRTVQVHGAHVAAVGPKDVAVLQQATDGLVTQTTSIPLVMAFADCTPVMLVDPISRVVGIAHAGWRGTVAGVCQATVQCMEDSFGCRASDIMAAIGPAIGPCCYQVGMDVYEAIVGSFGDADGLFRSVPDGGFYFNQWAANERALRQAGVNHVEQAEMCTACHVNEFYSHRAERGRTGRFGAMIMLRES